MTALVTLTLSAAGLAGAQPATAAPETDAALRAVQMQGVYEIQNVNSGMNLGIYGSSTANGAKIAQWDDEVNSSGWNQDQLWAINTNSIGETYLYSSFSDKVMAVATPRTDNWAKIIQWSFSGNADQVWGIEDLGAGQYQIRNQGSNKCLAIPNASTSRGIQAVQYTCNGGRDQKWRLTYLQQL